MNYKNLEGKIHGNQFEEEVVRDFRKMISNLKDNESILLSVLKTESKYFGKLFEWKLCLHSKRHGSKSK